MARADNSDDRDRVEVKVEDRRRFGADGEPVEPLEEEPLSGEPSEPSGSEECAELRARAVAAEEKLRDFQQAYVAWKEEQEGVRARLERDVDRKVALRFGDLAAEVLAVVDDLDLALEHARDIEAAEPLAQGVAIARDRFLTALARLDVERVVPDGAEFDPHLAEAVAVEPIDDASRHNHVVKTLRPGYRLGDRTIRPARVVVARLSE